MKILFYHACAFNKSPLCELIDEAEKFIRDGHEVYFATCSGLMNCCCSNPTSNQLDCKVCRLSMRRSLSMLSPSVHLIRMKDFSKSQNHDFSWDYSNVNKLKKIIYKDVELGYSVLSLYISLTRNLNPQIDIETKPFFDNLLSQGAILTDAFSEIIKDIHPDKICVFNGRLVESRPVLQTALLNHIPTDVYELMGGGNQPYYKVIFQNNLPHNIDYLTQLIEKAWDNSSKSLEKKIEIGKSFFENRRRGITAGDKVYISGQQQGLLPSNWDQTKRNIVIFNSSEDEFAAIGDQFDKYALFSSQMEGLISIFDSFKDNQNIHFYLRVHPNLQNINYKYHTDLYKLPQQYSNLSVIPANEKVSTYALMDAAEKVIVFGSTMGIESVYWGKPVILLAGSVYYQYDICYKPSSLEELTGLIISQNLLPKQDMTVCYKYGFFCLDTERAFYKNSYHFFNYNSFIKTFGNKTFHGTFCQTLFGSCYIYAYWIAALRFLSEKLCINSKRIPLKEE